MYSVYIISIFIICVYIGYYINKNFIECRGVVNDPLNKSFRDKYYKLNYVSNKCKHCLLYKICNKNAFIIKDKIYGKDVDWDSIFDNGRKLNNCRNYVKRYSYDFRYKEGYIKSLDVLDNFCLGCPYIKECDVKLYNLKAKTIDRFKKQNYKDYMKVVYRNTFKGYDVF